MRTEVGYARLRGVLRRRRLPMLMVAGATLALAGLAIVGAKPRYRATAVVRVLESQPAREYVAPPVLEQIGERLKTLRLALMARPLLDEVALEQNLYADGQDHDAVLDDMRGRIEVKVEGEDTFLLLYEDPQPQRAQAIVNRVAERFMAQQVRRRDEVASATVQALRAEAKALEPEVEAREFKVRDFKLSHYGALPEQQEQNLRLLDQTTMEINIQSTNLDMDNERRRQLIAAMASPLRRQEEQLATALHEARTRYVPNHPEVLRIVAEHQAVHRARIEEEKELRKRARTLNPELIGLDGEIRRTEALLAGLRARQEEVRGRVSETAKNGQALARLTADYDQVHTKHQTVMSRLREAELAVRLERGLRDLRYELVEGALLPSSPVAPNRPMMALGALLGALALGLAVGFGLDRADTRIYAPAELQALGRPVEVLACVPDLERPRPPNPKSGRRT